MNAPMEPGLRVVALDDKYDATEGTVYLTGTQALVRLPLEQRRRDLAAGHNTAGYISGYRGSPVGGYDQALWKAREALERHHVKFVPGVNEDLAATALWGTQTLNAFPGDARYDGVFGIWYGKGPGVDRSGDAFRHANQAGTSPLGGVLAVGGDDHGAKSSTMAAQTDMIFSAVSMPVLAPATVQDYLDLGLHGFAMSRFAGLWVAFKAVTDTIETAAIVDVSDGRLVTRLPDDYVMPPGGLNVRWPEESFLKLEERLTRFKIPAALAYARANRLDAHVFGRPDGEPCRLGIVATGKAWLDLMQALADLGIDDGLARQIGLKVYKVAMPWPLEPEGARRFCIDCDEVLVVEEKRALIEPQLKDQLYALARRPRITGKRDAQGTDCLPEVGELSPAILCRVLARQLDALGMTDEMLRARIAARLSVLEARERAQLLRPQVLESAERIPYFCSGCPHNTSTRVPEGSRAMAGIGCHYMALWMDRSTATATHMGAEGLTWVGQAPFSKTAHVFQNLGDGTYFHSGSLAIRAAVATRTPITYKILFNDAVAMTGGQRHDGTLTPQAIARQVRAEGVEKVVVVTDEPDKYPAGAFDADVAIYHRSRLDEVQRELRTYPGVSVLIYDQTCAAEKRRRRKRGAFPDPARRAVINEAVCEGCGDCGVQSNCVSIEPVETEFGRKRAINQSSCNKDFSCVQGFCPSFVTVEGGRLRSGRAAAGAPASTQPTAAQMPLLPEPQLPAIDGSYALLVTGIGGTGVVTVGQLLGMAAHLEGKGVTVLDMAGLAQKNGAVMSFVRFARTQSALHAPRIGAAAADAVLGCDVLVTAGRDALSRVQGGRTRVVANMALQPTAEFTRKPDWSLPVSDLRSAITDAVGTEHAWFVDASRLATALLGDAIASNLFMLGFAYQQGLLPVSSTAIEQAIRLNEVAIEQNLAAFRWGRRAAFEPDVVERAAAPAPVAAPVSRLLSATLEELVARRVDLLTDYQNEAWARRYLALVDVVRAAESRLEPGIAAAVAGGATPLGKLPFTEAVARNFARLMAYKDEYEVARLHSNGEFERRIAGMFEGDFTLRFHLAPPLFAKRNARGELQKQDYGPWMMRAMRLLAAFKRIRGTWLDPFGRSQERRTERQLIDDYEREIREVADLLDAERREPAVALASLPESIRGFGHVKERNLLAAAERRTQLLAQLRAKSRPRVVEQVG